MIHGFKKKIMHPAAATRNNAPATRSSELLQDHYKRRCENKENKTKLAEQMQTTPMAELEEEDDADEWEVTEGAGFIASSFASSPVRLAVDLLLP